MVLGKPQGIMGALRADPLGAALLDLAQRRRGLWLVGGAVRDLLVGRPPRELDVVVEGDALVLAEELAAIIDGTLTRHESFGTAGVRSAPGASGSWAQVDLAGARVETYRHPGALPEVRPGSLDRDLARRDFTVNSIAIALGPPTAGAMRAPAPALEDLRAGRLRVLHDASFRDDPTRLLRLARYQARLGFEVEPHTAELATGAVAGGALCTVSGARLGAELRLALREAVPLAALGALDRLGVLAAAHPRLGFDRPLSVRALELLGGAEREDLLLLAALATALAVDPDGQAAARGWLERLEFPAADRDVVAVSVGMIPTLAEALAQAQRPSDVRRAVGSASPQAVALAGALGPGAAAGDWLAHLRHVRLGITGDDLLAAGVAAGPEIGRRLSVVLDLRLNGLIAAGDQAELDAARHA